MNSSISLLLLCILFTTHVQYTESRMLDSSELLVGEWDLSIRCDPSWFHSELFPPRKSVAESEFDEEVDFIKEAQKKRQQQAGEKHSHHGRHHSCQLRLYSDHTFCLSPKEEEEEPEHYKHNQHHHTTTTSSEHNFLTVRGRWKVESNPYCVTDRFFDEISLTSYPRVKKIVQPAAAEEPSVVSSSSLHNHHKEKILQKGSIHMQCRLTGHFSPGRLSRRFRRDGLGWYGKAHLSRGMVTWETITNNNNNKNNSKADIQRSKPPQAFRASFSGRRWIPPLSILHSGDDEEEEEDFHHDL